MVRKSMAVTLLIGLVTVSFSQIPKMRATDRIAISHDGNNWDKDDTYAYAMDYAVIWAHGMQKQLVHQQINNLLSKDTRTDFYQAMLESGKGRFLFPGFDTTIQKDCHLDDGKAAVAHFAKVAGESSDQSLLFFIVCGPMEVPWQSLNATAKEKRKYIRVLSHSDWNEDHTGGKGLLNHTFQNMMASFSGDGVQFYSGAKKGYTKPLVIQDQNNNLGGGGSAKWNFLSSMTGSVIPQSTWTWLKGRDFKENGDCSDNGLVWMALTGNQNAKATPEAEAAFKNPLSMVAKFPADGSTAISQRPNSFLSNNKTYNVTVKKIGNTLNIAVPEMTGNGSVVVYDLLSRVVAEGAIENGMAKLPASSKISGNHFVKISSNGVDISQLVSLK